VNNFARTRRESLISTQLLPIIGFVVKCLLLYQAYGPKNQPPKPLKKARYQGGSSRIKAVNFL
jgi:hypothetical protein